MTQVYSHGSLEIHEASSADDEYATNSDPSLSACPTYYNVHESPFLQEEDSYEIPPEWTNKYSYVRTLGMGAYGNVMLVKLKTKPVPPPSATEKRYCDNKSEAVALSLSGANQHQPSREYSHPWEYRAVKVTRNEDVEHCGLRMSSISQSTIQELTLMQNIHGKVGDDEDSEIDRNKHKERNPNGNHVISCEDYTSTSQRFLLVMPYANCGTVENWLQSSVSLSTEPSTQCLSTQLLKALDCIHQNSYIHLDIKPENLLLFRDHGRPSGFLLRLADFGLSKYHAPFSRTFADTELVTPYFRPPEVFFAGVLTKLCDVWSAGVIFYQILTKERPFVLDPNVDFTYLYFFQLICAKIGTPSRSDLKAMHVCPEKSLLDQLNLVGPPLQSGATAARNLLVERVQEVLKLRGWARETINAASTVLERTVVINPRKRLSASRLLELSFFTTDFSQPTPELAQPAAESILPKDDAATDSRYNEPESVSLSSELRNIDFIKPKHYYCGIASSSPLCSSPVKSNPVTPLHHQEMRGCIGTDNLSLIKNTDKLNLLSSPINNQSSTSLTQQMDQTFQHVQMMSSPLAGLYSPLSRCKKPVQRAADAAAPLESRPNSPPPAHHGALESCSDLTQLQSETEVCCYVTAASGSDAQRSPLPFASLTNSAFAPAIPSALTTPSLTPVGRRLLKNPLAESLKDAGSPLKPHQQQVWTSPAPTNTDDASMAPKSKKRFREDSDDESSMANNENIMPSRAAEIIKSPKQVRVQKKTRILQ